MKETTMEIQPGNAASVSSVACAYQNEQMLVEEFDALLTFRKQNRLELGQTARELKKIHIERGERQKGKGWEAFLTDRELNDRTVDRWIEAYEIANALRPDKTVRDILSRTTKENKEVNLKRFSEVNGLDLDSHSERGFRNVSLSEEETPPPERSRANSNLSTHIYHGDSVATARERSDWLFKHALDVFERANKASGQALHEWDEAASRVRTVLAAYKRDEVDNPNADFSPIAIGEEE